MEEWQLLPVITLENKDFLIKSECFTRKNNQTVFISQLNCIFFYLCIVGIKLYVFIFVFWNKSKESTSLHENQLNNISLRLLYLIL